MPVIRFSGRIIVTLIVLFLLVGINFFIIFFIIRDIENDALIINYTGILRGGIQRIVKRETNGIRSDQGIRQIDSIFGMFLTRQYRISLFREKQKSFILQQTALKKTWDEMKEMLRDYRRSPGEKSKKQILRLSEVLWTRANKIVFLAESISADKIRHFDLIIIVLAVNLALIAGIILLIKNLVRDRLEHMANIDRLTGLLNRSSFEIVLEQQISMARRYGNSFFLIMFDIDRFKRVNDTCGHETGDDVLRTLSALVRKNIRQNDIFARGGGEEFFILCPEQDIKKIRNFSHKIRKLVGRHRFRKAGTITISLGLTLFRKSDTPASLLKRADNALYAAKRKGRNTLETRI